MATTTGAGVIQDHGITCGTGAGREALAMPQAIIAP
jgi:hypothetical protein